MRRILLLVLGIAWLATTVAAQDPVPPNRGNPVPKEKNRIKMDRPAEEEGKKDDAEKPEEPKREPEKPVDPFERALAGLASWPAATAKEAAANLALLGPEVEERLIPALNHASPALSAGICFVLGEVGGDASLKALHAVAGRPSMVDHLDVVFEALGKLDGLNAARRILPFLRHPKRPARTAAEAWLRAHLDASHADRLEGLLSDASRGARLSAFRLLMKVAPDRARLHAVALLGDESPELARTAAELLATSPGGEIRGELNRIVVEEDPRPSAYAALALALLADRIDGLPYEPAAVNALLGAAGLRSPDKLNRGAAAVVLADVGYAGRNEEVDAYLDRQVVDVLLDTFGGQTFFKDYSSLAELARDRFAKLTGILERRPVPELWAWWKENREGFVARRELLSLDPESLHEFRVRARSLTEPALPTSLFSNVVADAIGPDALGVRFVFLLPDDVRDLATLVGDTLLPLPEAAAVDPFRVEESGAAAALGPEVVVTVTADRRSRTVTARRGDLPPPVLAVLARLRMLAKEKEWQQFWDRGTYPRYGDFIQAEAAWFATEHTPEVVEAHLKEMILASLDDLVTPERRAAAMDMLDAIDAPLSDSDAYALALLLEREDGLTPFARRLVRAVARTGRSLVLPILSDWLEEHPGPESLDLFAEALAKMGARQVLVAAASDRVYAVRAAMRAAPAALEGDELLETLTVGLREQPIPVKRDALLSLGRSGLAGALPLIRTALDHEDVGIRNAAIAALGMLGRPEVVPVLAREVTSDDFGHRVAAVTALCRSGLDAALGPVLACVRRDPSPAVRAVAAREVVSFGDRALGGLSAIVTDTAEKPEVRAQAVEALTRIGGDQVVAVLVALLEDPADPVADAAAFALASRQKKQAVPRLLDALETGRDAIRTVAALEQVSSQSFPSARAEELPAIYRGWWSDHRDEPEAKWFVNALAARGYDVADLDTLGTPDPSPNTIPVLVRALLDGEWYLRANANLWLTRITLEDFGEVTRFTTPAEVREVRARWREWWEAR